MKTSISIPDDLWARVNTAGDGPSAVVQRALTLLADEISEPMALAPTTRVRERLQHQVDLTVERLSGEFTTMLEWGYEVGISLGGHLRLADLESLGTDPAQVVSWLNEIIDRLYDDSEQLLLAGAHVDFGYPAALSSLTPEVLRRFYDYLHGLVLAEVCDVQLIGDELHWDVPYGESYSCPVSSLEVDRWSMPDALQGVGQFLRESGRLPEGCARGVAAGLIDLRNAALSRIHATRRASTDSIESTATNEEANS